MPGRGGKRDGRLTTGRRREEPQEVRHAARFAPTLPFPVSPSRRETAPKAREREVAEGARGTKTTAPEPGSFLRNGACLGSRRVEHARTAAAAVERSRAAASGELAGALDALRIVSGAFAAIADAISAHTPSSRALARHRSRGRRSRASGAVWSAIAGEDLLDEGPTGGGSVSSPEIGYRAEPRRGNGETRVSAAYLTSAGDRERGRRRRRRSRNHGQERLLE